LHPAHLPDEIKAHIAPHVAEFRSALEPPFLPTPELPAQLAACRDTGLMTVSGTRQQPRWSVHRWTASELARRYGGNVRSWHRRAARYWCWRAAWQTEEGGGLLHDLVEAHYHLICAGDSQQAIETADKICNILQKQSAWDEELSFVNATLPRLTTGSSVEAQWLHRVGVIARCRGDHEEAARAQTRALAIFESADDKLGMWPIFMAMTQQPSNIISAQFAFLNNLAIRIDWPNCACSSACTPRRGGTGTQHCSTFKVPLTGKSPPTTRPRRRRLCTVWEF